jgi:hypothetical protein
VIGKQELARSAVADLTHQLLPLHRAHAARVGLVDRVVADVGVQVQVRVAGRVGFQEAPGGVPSLSPKGP